MHATSGASCGFAGLSGRAVAKAFLLVLFPVLLLLATASFLEEDKPIAIPSDSSDSSGESMASKASVAVLRVVFVTAPSNEVATKLARSVDEGNLAACVNVIPGIKSIYSWEGKVHEDDVHLLVLKTTEYAISALREKILSLHPYDTPEFVSMPVTEASEKYAEWVRVQTEATLNK